MEIFATKERQEVLDEFKIKYAVDTELNLIFNSKKDEERAIKVMKSALVL